MRSRAPFQKRKIPLRYMALAGVVCVGLVFSGNARVQAPRDQMAPETERTEALGVAPAGPAISQRADTVAVYGTEPLPGDRSKQPEPVVNLAALSTQNPATQERATPDCVDHLQEMAQVFTIWFDGGGMTIDAQGRDMLRMIGTKAKACPQAHVIVGGHAYAASSDAENRRISWNRADAALDVLRAFKLDAANIEPRGFGAEQPFAEGDSGEDAENRRIDFRVIRIE